MQVSFIGAGKVGTSLGKYFTTKGIPVVGYYSKTLKSAQDAAKFTNSKYYTDLQKMICDSNMIFFTVPDDAIALVWEQVKTFISGKTVIHCSGLCSSKIFSDAEKVGCTAYSVHPLCAVGSRENSYSQLSSTLFTIEGEGNHQHINSLFNQLGNKTKFISAENKTKYHGAASLASNHVTAILYMAREILVECGFSSEEAENELVNLARGNLNNISSMGLINSLTGPVERNDIHTVRKHISVLEEESKDIYRGLAVKLIEISEKKNPKREYDEMKMLIKSGNRKEEA